MSQAAPPLPARRSGDHAHFGEEQTSRAADEGPGNHEPRAAREVSLDTLVRDVVQAILRDELPPALREALRSVLGEFRLPVAANVGSRSSGASAPDALHTVREVALELKVTEPTVREWIKSGELPARRLGGRGQKRLLRITRENLDEFKRRRAAGDDADAGSVDEQARDILNTVRAKGARR